MGRASSATPRCSSTPAATTRPTGPRESDQIDFAGRRGFARLAIEHNCPIVPVVAIGGQETALFLGQGRDLARRFSSTACCA